MGIQRLTRNKCNIGRPGHLIIRQLPEAARGEIRKTKDIKESIKAAEMHRYHSTGNIIHCACGKLVAQKRRIHGQGDPIYLCRPKGGQIGNIMGETTSGEVLQETKIVNDISCVTAQRYNNICVLGKPWIARVPMHNTRLRRRKERH